MNGLIVELLRQEVKRREAAEPKVAQPSTSG
jgi:hypothetical protein